MTIEIIKDLSLLGMIIGYGVTIITILSLTVGYSAYNALERAAIEMMGGKIAAINWWYLVLGIIATIIWSHL